MHKFLWPLLVVNLSIPGLIWRGTAYFVQNNTTIILPGDTRRTTSQLPCRAPVNHFWRQNRSLETRNGSYFSLLANYFGFWNYKSLFVDYLMPSPVTKAAWFQLDVRTLEFFPSAESWLVNSNFPRASRMQGHLYCRVTEPEHMFHMKYRWPKFCVRCSAFGKFSLPSFKWVFNSGK